MTTESNSTNTVSVGGSPLETRKHKVKQKQDEKGLIETKDTENKSEKTSKQNGDVVHQSRVGRRRSKQSNHTVQVDVHVHNVSDNETGNGVVSNNKCDRKSSISLGHTIQSDDITEDNNKSGIASVDINRTPTIRVTKSNSVNVTSQSSSRPLIQHFYSTPDTVCDGPYRNRGRGGVPNEKVGSGSYIWYSEKNHSLNLNVTNLIFYLKPLQQRLVK